MRISLSQASDLINAGQVIAVPTETVYGLAASLKFPTAIDQIFKLKGRPTNNPLIVHAANAYQVSKYLKSQPEDFVALAKAFWPGPLTLVLPVKESDIPYQARAGLPTAAFRVPNHSLALALLEWVGPLVMPSANLSGSPSSTHYEHVEADFGTEFPVLDGGACGHGVESTILYFVDGQWQIARLGAIPAEAFEMVLGYKPEVYVNMCDSKPLCPGQLYRHYAPKTKLRLSHALQSYDGVVVGFSDRHYLGAHKVYCLGPSKQPEVVAENLYATLRQLDIDKIESVIVDMDFPEENLWVTIGERLRRAAQ